MKFEDVTRPKAVAIGISTGGPATLQEVLPLIPADLPASLFLVQHMPPTFIASFAKRLDEHCALKVVEARSGMPVEPSVCYVAPGGMHLCLHRKMTGEVVIRTPTTPATLFVPSVGVMMASVLGIYGTDTIGVLMTGIGDDGADSDGRDQAGWRVYDRRERADRGGFRNASRSDRARWSVRSRA